MRWAVLASCFWMLLAEHSVASQELPRGQIIDSVQCAADPTQSYSLYLPAAYTPERAWPLLMGFHPGARGRAIVEKYRDAAERYGYIVAASNNSRNGPWEVSGRAVTAMAQDLGTRFSTDPKRLYATGHSGGARVALQLALRNPIAGVIASSAGFPDRLPHSKLSFVLFGTAGETDFNYIEMKMLDNSVRSPHRVVIFDGGHTLPPDDLAMEAIEWLELQAIRSGIRQKDDALVSVALDQAPRCRNSGGRRSRASRAVASGSRRRLQGSPRRKGAGGSRRDTPQEPGNETRTRPSTGRGPFRTADCSRRSAASRPA